MNLFKIILSFAVIFSCKKKIETISISLQPRFYNASKASNKLEYIGLLGSNSIIHLKLHSISDSIHGSYVYNNNKDSLILKGHKAKDSLFLNAYYQDKNTGKMKGFISGDLVFIGSWFSANNNKKIEFKLQNFKSGLKYKLNNSSHCDISINLFKDKIFLIQKKEPIKGIYKQFTGNNTTYISFNKFEGIVYNDTISIQNYGNAMNPYIYFEECNSSKYLHFVKVKK